MGVELRLKLGDYSIILNNGGGNEARNNFSKVL
jgi:hypothetical protein